MNKILTTTALLVSSFSANAYWPGIDNDPSQYCETGESDPEKSCPGIKKGAFLRVFHGNIGEYCDLSQPIFTRSTGMSVGCIYRGDRRVPLDETKPSNSGGFSW